MKMQIFKIVKNLKKYDRTSLLGGSLIFLAGIALASIGIIKLSGGLQTWLSSGTPLGPPFDIMMSTAIGAVILILPSIVFFVVGYLLAKSHSLGLRLSFILSISCIILGVVITINVPLTIAGVLCFLGSEIEFLTRKKTSQKKLDSPIVTEKVAKLGLTFSGIIGAAILIGIICYITVRGINYISWDFITGANWSLAPGLKDLIDGTQPMGISELIIGSFLVVGLCEVIALPLGLGAAIYMSEYAPQNKFTDTIRFFIETLAGAPSIVIALFGFFVLVNGNNGLGWGQSWLAASVCLSFMTLPWNIRVAEEAMKAVPYSFREGAYALGATKWQTIRRIVLLASAPGAITGFVLGLGAAFGETTVLILTSDLGHGTLPAGLPLTQGGMPTLPVQIFRTYRWTIGGGGKSYQWEQTNVAFAAGLVLLVIFLIITVVALLARNYITKKNLGR